MYRINKNIVVLMDIQLQFQQFLQQVQIMSMHGGSSVMSSQNPEAKYKKALKEISKLINANKVIREESEQTRKSMQEQMNELALRYHDVENQNHKLEKERESLEKYCEQLQESHSELQKEHHTTEKQLAYLNDMLTELNAELKKVQMIKDEKKITQLIRSYEEKEHEYQTERNKNQEMIHRLRDQIEAKDTDIVHEKLLREEAQEKYSILSTEISKYKELNAALISRNQKIYKQFYDKEGTSREKQREIQSLVQEFRKQITCLKTVKENVNDQIGNHYQTSYELLLQQKNRIIVEYAQLKDQYENCQNKIRDTFDLQEKMKSAVSRADRLSEQCNMLKSKIVVLQSRDLMDQGIDFEFNPKDFDDKITNLLSQGDPLLSIKNSDETSHFKILRSFIIELREKMEKINAQRKQYMNKYKSISSKHSALAQDSAILEQQNKLLRGKTEGFQKLTDKLQNELEKNLVIHEEQITKLTNVSNELISQRDQEIESASKFFKEQMEILQDRSSKNERSFKQEVECLKLQVTALKIRNQELQQKIYETNEFVSMYKKKLNDINLVYEEVEEKNQDQSQTLIKVQQMLKDQKSKNQSLNSQKQQLTSKIAELSDEIQRKNAWYQEQIKNTNENYQLQNKRLKGENGRMKEELQLCKKQINSLRRQSEQKRSRDNLEIEQLRRQNNYFKDIQSQFNRERQKNRELQSQNETLKLKNSKHSQQLERISQVQEDLLKKNDECHDLTRKILNMQSILQQLESGLKEEKTLTENLRKEISATRMKLLQNSQQVKKQVDSKDQSNRNLVLKLNEDISEINMLLNEEKTKNSRLNSEIHKHRSQNERLQQFCQQLKDKQNKLTDSIGQLKVKLQETIQENQKIKSESRLHQMTIKRQSQEIENVQKRINSVIQDQSALRIKEQESENSKQQIIRELQSLRFYFTDIEEYIIKSKNKTDMAWEEQRVRNSMSQIISRLKKLLKAPDSSYQIPLSTPIQPFSAIISVPEIINTNTTSNKHVTSNPIQYTTTSSKHVTSNPIQYTTTSNKHVTSNPIQYSSYSFTNTNSNKYVPEQKYSDYTTNYEFTTRYETDRNVVPEYSSSYTREGLGEFSKDFFTGYADNSNKRNYQ